MGTASENRKGNLDAMLAKEEQVAGRYGAIARLAKRLGLPPSLVSQYKNGTRQVGDDVARKIELKLRFRRGQFDLPNLGEFEPGPEVSNAKGVPIVGSAMLGQDGYFVEEEHPPGFGDGFVPHPSADRSAYSLRVVGESMAPAILSGWLVVIEPSGEPVVGEYVHVLTKTGQHMIKKLLSNKQDSVSVVSVNGGAIHTFARAELEFVRHVGGIYPPSKRRL